MNKIKTKNVFILNFFKFYNLLWTLCLPLLSRNRRLKHGFSYRVNTTHLQPADIWIQAASAGEAYLAVTLVKRLSFSKPTSVLVTSLTAQGMDLLKNSLTAQTIDPNINLSIEWFVFDKPSLMEKAVNRVQPRIMILLETELWPALLHHLKQNQTKIFIINARLSEKTFNMYMRTRFLWKHLAPDHILATSEQDKKRYACLFETARVDTMPNIKFETLDMDMTNPTSTEPTGTEKIRQILPEHLPLTILASVRKKEEKILLTMIKRLGVDFPDQVIAVFPRHLHRIAVWEKMLVQNNLNFSLRSTLEHCFDRPGIILWDTFGELKTVYQFAQVVFVGGSLKPYGGQNFIEPALQGAITITGPFYNDFAWAKEMFKQQMVIKQDSPDTVYRSILSGLQHPMSRSDQIKLCKEHIRLHSGGTDLACQKILKSL